MKTLVFFKIMLPLAIPTIATVALFTALAYWNDWTNGLYYITDTNLYGIQNLLIRIMNNIQFLKSSSNAALLGTQTVDLPGTSVRMALAVIGILPILIIFPFAQKYFVKGVMIESYLVEGNQSISENQVYGKSITDACLGWEDSERLIYDIADRL